LEGTSSSAGITGDYSRNRSTTQQKGREARKFFEALAYLVPSFIIFFSFVFIPLVRTFWLGTQLTDPLGRPRAFVGLRHYQELFSQPDFLNSLLRSFQFAIYTVPSTIIVSIVLALLGNLRLRRIALFRMFYSFPIAVSAATTSLIFMYLFHPALGSVNYFLSFLGIKAVPWLVNTATALPALSMTTVWLQLGLNTIVMLAGMQDIPEDLYASARIDGAGAWRVFRSITLPLLTPTLFFLLVVDTLANFQTFTQVQIMTSGGPVDSTNLLVFSIYRQFYFNGQYGYAAAQSVMLFLLMLVLTIIQFGVLERRVHYT